MAALATMTMGELNEERKTVYPLFQKNAQPRDLKPKKVEKTAPTVLPDEPPKRAPGRPPKKPKKAASAESLKVSTTLQNEGAINGEAELLEVDPNKSRRKRQKTNSETAENLEEQSKDRTAQKAGTIESLLSGRQSNGIHGTDDANGVQELPSADRSEVENVEVVSDVENDVSKTLSIPKKILRLNPKTGTIGSPPPKKQTQPTEAPGKGRGRSPRSKIVIFRYGLGERLPEELGHKINAIMSGAKLDNSTPVETASAPPKITKAAQPPKPVHPLFLGKSVNAIADSKAEVAKNAVKPEVIDLSTPVLGRARARSNTERSPPRPKAAFAGFGKSSTILKFPGAMEPVWPWQGMVHIRGMTPKSSDETNGKDKLHNRSKARKSKYRAINVRPDEEVLGILAADLGIANVVQSIRDINPDEFPALPPCLRIPTKHYEGGSAIQRRVRGELKTKMPLANTAPSSSSDEEIQTNAPNRAPTHPALSKIYNLIKTTMSYFDLGQCETQSWTQKYCPKSTAEVLQSGREALILKEWLQRLTVQSVENGSGDKAGPKADNPSKRKRKAKKLDGFVVSSDEDGNDMDEITDPEDDITCNFPQDLLKTVIRSGDTAKDSKKVTNAVVISGPHGCGKTAAVYAVAKELGFEVFEINSSSRRSGKDILEKVGDMTRNHLVQRSQDPAPVNEDDQRIDDALAQDLQSGRQGTMNSFFKPKEPTRPKVKPSKPKPASKKEIQKTDAAPKAQPRQQKQSLILIEEADILYESDKGFWATVLELIAQSKRPIIITCSDESILPMNSLPLYAVLRFVPPPIDLATDYLLLVAACEGHCIRRGAVKTLYEGRNLDLRASLTDLNFWCQFAVGDQKSGMDWFYPRWSRDAQKHEEAIRVVSENTYESGMGWLSQDILESHVHHLDIEEEVLHETCDGWQLDVGNWHDNIDIDAWAQQIQTTSCGTKEDIAALKIYEDFAATMSEIEVLSGQSFAPDSQVLLDVNMPPLSAKVQEDYILPHQLIDASPLVDFTTTSKDISLWMKSRARKYLQVDQHITHGFEVPTQLDRPSEADVLHMIKKQGTSSDSSLSRVDFSRAFDPISEAEKYVWNTATSLEASSFDRNMSIISIDIAPYVRSIVAYDARLQDERTRMSNLLSEGGRKGKRMRTTRAAMSALEGGARSTTRRERYFGTRLNSQFVLKTGMQSWLDAAVAEENVKREALKEEAEVKGPAEEDHESEKDDST